MTTPPALHPEHYQQPALPADTPCCRCGRALDQTRGAGWWDGRWWCIPCLAKGNNAN